MNKQVILTGIRANNNLHIGNYFGALLPPIEMAKNRADQYQINLFVPDLHSFTTPIDHSDLKASIMNNLRLYVAAGLPIDHPDVHIYRQSYISAHSELTVILNCFTGVGEMERMTQYKDKSSKLGNDRVTLGLFDYPVLMAADILLYGAKYVPVGDDQSQHLEITRDIGERMNNKFGSLFTIPLAVSKQHQFFGNEQGLRIKDLVDPSKKMSKSDETAKGIIFLSDEPKAAAKKIMGATTDNIGVINLDYANQPGISNLLQILALLTGRSLDSVASEYKGQTSYGELKKVVAKATEDFLTTFQQKYNKVDLKTLEEKLIDSESKMSVVANQTLNKVQKAVGLR